MTIHVSIAFVDCYPAGRYVVTITYRLSHDHECAGSFDYPGGYQSERAAREAAASINFNALVAAHIAAEAAKILAAARFTTNAKVVIS